MPTFTSNDAEINYQTFGDSTQSALIFSNSLGTQYSMWQSQIDALKDDFFIVCYDTRGHGNSSAPKGAYTIEQLGNDVINLLDHLDIQTAIFCGISLGGLTGQWLAIHHPQRFKKMIICNTAAKIGQEQAWNERAQLVREQGLAAVAASAASRWFTESFIQSHSKLVSKLSNELATTNPQGYASCCDALAKADLSAQIQSISIPVLVVTGTQDPITTTKDAQFIVNNIRNSALFEIEASHISNIEQPEAFNHAVYAFVQ